jgi:endonuclease-3
MTKSERARAAQVLEGLKKAYPDAQCELNFASPFQLLVATVLSAQSTDVAVNLVTPALFKRWPTADKLAKAVPTEVEAALSRIGMYRQKSRNIIGLSKLLVVEHQGQVPDALESLVKLPGVGRKTANVVLGVAFGKPEGVVVDTHVQRLSQRLGLTPETSPERIEEDLMRHYARDEWELLPHLLIFHGRRCCTARKPNCAGCPIQRLCPSAFEAENVGRKAPRTVQTIANVAGAKVRPGAAVKVKTKPAKK